jgi:hypothetical protein
MIGATGDQLASEDMAQTASLRYPRRSSFQLVLVTGGAG